MDQSHPSAGNGVNTVESAIASAFRVDSKAGALRSAMASRSARVSRSALAKRTLSSRRISYRRGKPEGEVVGRSSIVVTIE